MVTNRSNFRIFRQLAKYITLCYKYDFLQNFFLPNLYPEKYLKINVSEEDLRQKWKRRPSTLVVVDDLELRGERGKANLRSINNWH